MTEFTVEGSATVAEIAEAIHDIEVTGVRFLRAEIREGENVLHFVVGPEPPRPTLQPDGAKAPPDSETAWIGLMQVKDKPTPVRLYRRKAAGTVAAESGVPARATAGAARVRAASGRAGNARSMIPAEKPRLGHTELQQRIAPYGIDPAKYPLVVVGIRGYYKNSMGAPGVNDRGIYDDALFIVSDQATVAFNGNTDPSAYRKGSGRGAGKGVASLNPGAWFAHRFDKHNGKYMALCQRAAEVTVTRDGEPPYRDSGMFGINIHRGAYNGTSSLGCQTIHPDQWESFITLATDQARRYHGDAWQKRVVPYVLLES